MSAVTIAENQAAPTPDQRNQEQPDVVSALKDQGPLDVQVVRAMADRDEHQREHVRPKLSDAQEPDNWQRHRNGEQVGRVDPHDAMREESPWVGSLDEVRHEQAGNRKKDSDADETETTIENYRPAGIAEMVGVGGDGRGVKEG